MAVFSKIQIVNESILLQPCHKIMHPWSDSCIKSSLEHPLTVLTSTFQFFTTLYASQIVINGPKKWNQTYFRDMLLMFLRSWSFGIVCFSMFTTSVCFLRFVLGRFYVPSLFFWPGTIAGGLSILCEHPSRRTMDVVSYLYTDLEIISNTLYSRHNHKHWRILETALFMVISCVIMSQLRKPGIFEKFTGYWLYKPLPIDYNQCHHSDSCLKYSFKVVLQSVLIGGLIDCLRKLMNFKKNRILHFDKSTYKFTIFVSLYTLFYQTSSCFLSFRRFCYATSLAGFIAGSMYYFVPNQSMIFMGIASILQMFYEIKLKNVPAVKKFYLLELIFAVLAGYMLHNRFFHPEKCPQMVIKLTDSATNNKATAIINAFMNSQMGR